MRASARRSLRPRVRCSIDGRMMTLARYPNVGFGHVGQIVDKGAVYAHGRTPGDPPKWSVENPIGGRFTVLGKDVVRVGARIPPGPEGTAHRLPVLRLVSRERTPWRRSGTGKSGLGDTRRYGVIKKHKIPRRIIVSNLLCELDAPGEFYFDAGGGHALFHSARTPGKGLAAEHLGRSGTGACSAAPRCHSRRVGDRGSGQRQGCGVDREWQPRRVGRLHAAQLVAAGGGDRGRAPTTGCTRATSTTCRITCRSVEADVRNLQAAGNFAINCHFTQVAAADYYGRIRLSGVGNVFRNNLVHNFPGQVMTFGDCDHRIELNEFFHIGFEEGDGGSDLQRGGDVELGQRDAPQLPPPPDVPAAGASRAGGSIRTTATRGRRSRGTCSTRRPTARC